MKLSERVEALERQVADLKEQVSAERHHKHLMIDNNDAWRDNCANLSWDNYWLRNPKTGQAGK